ncbi:MAG: glycosyltransferase family 2 protein [Candidatus Uhrbacteria bacterium]
MPQPSVAAIVPAHNEEQTLGLVLRALKNAPSVNEIVVVSDASVDATAEIARAAGTIVVELEEQHGKGGAMLAGLEQTEAEIIAFFDADLVGLTPEHVERIVLPVVSGSKAMNVGLRDRGQLITSIGAKLPLISGERAMRRSIISNIPERYMKGFMIESAFNYFCRSHGLVYGSVKMPGLTIVRKYEKVGWTQAIGQYLRMFYQIGKAMFWVRVMYRLGKF